MILFKENIRIHLSVEETLLLIFMQLILMGKRLTLKYKEILKEHMSDGPDFTVL